MKAEVRMKMVHREKIKMETKLFFSPKLVLLAGV
jgi:hypothetical protein